VFCALAANVFIKRRDPIAAHLDKRLSIGCILDLKDRYLACPLTLPAELPRDMELMPELLPRLPPKLAVEGEAEVKPAEEAAPAEWEAATSRALAAAACEAACMLEKLVPFRSMAGVLPLAVCKP